MKKGLVCFAMLSLLLFPVYAIGKPSLIIRDIIGFKNIYLGDSKDTVLTKIKNYGLDYKASLLTKDNVVIDPYLIMSKEFSYKYTPSYLLFELSGNSYYISFDNIDFLHPNFMVRPKADKFFLYYSRLSSLVINGMDSSTLNPYLANISFNFFDDSLYEVNYKVNLSLKEIVRFIDNLSSLYGDFKFKVSDSFALLEFMHNNINIVLKINKDTFSNIGHMEVVDYSSFINQAVFVSISKKDSLSKIASYKSSVYSDMLYMFKKKADSSLKAIKKAIKQSKERRILDKSSKDAAKYKHVDELTG